MDRSVQSYLAADMTTLTESNEVRILEPQPCHDSRGWHCSENPGLQALKGLPAMHTGKFLHQSWKTHASAVPARHCTTLLWSRPFWSGGGLTVAPSIRLKWHVALVACSKYAKVCTEKDRSPDGQHTLAADPSLVMSRCAVSSTDSALPHSLCQVISKACCMRRNVCPRRQERQGSPVTLVTRRFTAKKRPKPNWNTLQSTTMLMLIKKTGAQLPICRHLHMHARVT